MTRADAEEHAGHMHQSTVEERAERGLPRREGEAEGAGVNAFGSVSLSTEREMMRNLTSGVIEIVIPGEPVSQGRPRFARRGNFMVAYDPAKSRTWKATAQCHMRDAMAGAAPLQGPLSCEIAATFTCPRSHWRKRAPLPRRWHIGRPDADNLAKAVKDAGKGVLWLDDSQVARLVVLKAIGAQGEAPRVWLQVKPITEAP